MITIYIYQYAKRKTLRALLHRQLLYGSNYVTQLKSKKPTFTQPSYLKINRLTSKLTIMN